MPLSEHEQRMLDQIERALYAEDPKFANSVRQTNPAVHYKRRIIKAGLGFVVGVIMLLAGLILGSRPDASLVLPVTISVIGFGVMLLCFLRGANAYRKAAGGAEADAAAAAAEAEAQAAEPKNKRKDKGNKRPGMMNRFEERWRRRQEGDEH